MKISSSSFEHEGQTHIAVEVRNNGNQHICAACHKNIVPVKAYAMIKRSDENRTLHFYSVHKYCMVTADEHEEYMKELETLNDKRSE